MDEDGASFVYLAIVQSPYLDAQRVNPARTDFDIGGEDADVEPTLFDEEIKRSEIRDEAVELI